MIIYYMGSELPTYRRYILENGVTTSSLSYMGLRKRTKFTNPWLVSKYFPKGHRLFVDSGCQTLNSSKEEKYSDEELKVICEQYYSWVGQNLEDIQMFSEFDALQLGGEYLRAIRKTLSEEMSAKVLPIWHSETGIAELQSLGARYGKVGISQTNLGGRDLIPVLVRMASDGVELHGLSMTKPDIMQAVKWTSVSSTSWTSPQRYGDTIIWSHNQLKRYSKTDKDQARRKERSVFLANGFDIDKIEKDDPAELLKISLWSWEKLVDSINRKNSGTVKTVENPTAVTTTREEGEGDFIPEKVEGVGVAVSSPSFTPATRRPTQTIPVMSTELHTDRVKNPDTGQMEDKITPKVRIRSSSMRICDTCFLASKCPMFEPGSTCAYDIPITIRTKDQLQSAVDSLVEFQFQRVLFMKMVEDIEGGYADPNLSLEMDRWNRMVKTKHEMEQEGFQFTVTAKQNGQMSVVDRIFGDLGNTSKLRELESPVQVPDLFADMGFIDAEVVDLQEYNRTN